MMKGETIKEKILSLTMQNKYTIYFIRKMYTIYEYVTHLYNEKIIIYERLSLQETFLHTINLFLII